MIKKLQAIVVLLAFSACMACAGREANPVAQYQYGDEKKSCNHLKAEISQIDTEITSKMGQGSKRRRHNAAVGVIGGLLFWPALFALDLKKADVVELEALRKRRNSLVLICADKDCGFNDLNEVEKLEDYIPDEKPEEEKAKEDTEVPAT